MKVRGGGRSPVSVIQRRSGPVLAALAGALAVAGLSSAAATQQTGEPAWEDKPYTIVDGKVDLGTYNGYRRYEAYCLRCHGPDGAGSSYAPALAKSLKTLSYEDFLETVVYGRKNISASQQSVMPAFGEATTWRTSTTSIPTSRRAPTAWSAAAGRNGCRNRRGAGGGLIMVQGAAAAVLATALLAAGRAPGRRSASWSTGAGSASAPIPSNLPFSNQAGEGFENKIAELLARKLGVAAAPTPGIPQSVGFVRNTLGAIRCDLVIGVVGDHRADAEHQPLLPLELRADPARRRRAEGRLAARPRRSRICADRRRRPHARRAILLRAPGPARPCAALSADGRHPLRAARAGRWSRTWPPADRRRRSCGGRSPATGPSSRRVPLELAPLLGEREGRAARLPHLHGAAPQRAGVEARA